MTKRNSLNKSQEIKTTKEQRVEEAHPLSSHKGLKEGRASEGSKTGLKSRSSC